MKTANQMTEGDDQITKKMSVNTQLTKHRGVLGLIKLYLRNIDNYPS